MRTKCLALLLAVLMLGALAACGGGGGGAANTNPPSGGNSAAPAENTKAPETSTAAPGETNTEPPADEQGGTQTPDTYVFQANGGTAAIDQDMTEVLASLGEAKSYFEAASCAFNGLDKTYTYGGFVITTRPDGDKDYVNSIELTDDSVTTPEGLYIGCTVDEVKNVMGEGQELGTALIYTKGNTSLQFVTEDGVVTSICYLTAGAH